MADLDPERCPVHVDPHHPDQAWPCPDECPDYLAELDRRIEDVKVNGNFTRVSLVDGFYERQQYRSHQPVGEPTRGRPYRRISEVM